MIPSQLGLWSLPKPSIKSSGFTPAEPARRILAGLGEGFATPQRSGSETGVKYETREIVTMAGSLPTHGQGANRDKRPQEGRSKHRCHPEPALPARSVNTGQSR